MTIELLDLEGDVSLKEINMFSTKITKTFGKTEQKIVDLNDAKYKLSAQDADDLDYLSGMHLKIKSKFKGVMDNTQLYPPNAEN